MTSPGRLSTARLSTGVLSTVATQRRAVRLTEPSAAARPDHGDILHAFDALGQAVLAADQWGRVMHQTVAVEAMLAAEPEADVLRGAMQRLADSLFVPVMPFRPAGAAAPEVVRTSGAVYLLRGCLHASGAGPGRLALISVQRTTRGARTAGELRERYALTEVESAVALLLADGRSNAEVAAARGISPHTARRHTERILRKLGVRTRAGVARRLMD
jgi:DNA-binding CsgD family transcriptional regulator